MKKFKRAIMIGTILLGVGATSTTALAASNYNSPVEALAGITGKTVESVLTERAETGKSFGAIAVEAGKLDEYQNEVLEIKKENLAQRVESGLLTQQEADRIITSLEQNQALCDGTGYGLANKGMGRGRGMMGSGYGGMQGWGQGGCGYFGYGYNQAQ